MGITVTGGITFTVGTTITSSGGGFTPVTNTYNSGSGTETIPADATQLVLTAWGGGGKGGAQLAAFGSDGGGGGSGAYVTKTFTLSSGDWGKTLSYAVGAGGIFGAINGGTSTVTNGTFGTTVSFSSGGGVAGTDGTSVTNGTQGAGGTASGGTTNTDGNGSGLILPFQGRGAPNGGASVFYSTNGTSPGGGGGGGNGSSDTDFGNGAAGRIVFAYT